MRYEEILRNCNGLLRKLPIAVFLTIALFAVSCMTPKQITTNADAKQTTEINDSTVIETTVTPVVVPESKAELTVTTEELNNLPTGGEFQSKKGNARVRAKKEHDGTITITANCDSLVLLVEQLRMEVYHSQKENTELKTTIEQQELTQELSGWQWFQIWIGRIAMIIGALFIIF
jgi:hypothetical protein